LGRIGPAELLILEGDELSRRRSLVPYRPETILKSAFGKGESEQLLKEQLGVRSLVGFGCDDLKEGIVAAGALVHYLRETQKGSPEHIKELVTYRLGDFMFLDESTTRNLELFQTMRRQSTQGSLFAILDRTVTPMGSRLLKRWIGYPLVELEPIRLRLAAVRTLRDDRIFREELREQLEGIYDLERLNGRVSLGRANRNSPSPRVNIWLTSGIS
jgi:DNA mismatch repair protein MutS